MKRGMMFFSLVLVCWVVSGCATKYYLPGTYNLNEALPPDDGYVEQEVYLEPHEYPTLPRGAVVPGYAAPMNVRPGAYYQPDLGGYYIVPFNYSTVYFVRTVPVEYRITKKVVINKKVIVNNPPRREEHHHNQHHKGGEGRQDYRQGKGENRQGRQQERQQYRQDNRQTRQEDRQQRRLNQTDGEYRQGKHGAAPYSNSNPPRKKNGDVDYWEDSYRYRNRNQ